ncbi:MAG: ammonium transporter [Methanomethylophilus sp.]|jgi:Amt family ammonium transporter
MRKTLIIVIAAVLLAAALLTAGSSLSSAVTEPGTEDSGSVSWILVASALVFIMVPGVAFFYGGMLRKQSMTSMMAQTLAATAVMGISWIAVGYSLAFGDDGAIIGNLDYAFFNNVSENDIMEGGNISYLEFAIFQMMFALVTGALVLGAVAERMRFGPIIVFLALWSVLVYAPMAHWVWGGGWYDQYLTVLDFAGGTVVHICCGVSGLALCIFIGPRLKGTKARAHAHSVPFAYLGALLLWVGWFGFNGGSGLLADANAVHVFFTTMAAALFGMAAWGIAQYLVVGRVGVLGLIAGALAGLVAITPGAAYLGFGQAMITGAVGGALCYFAVRFIHSKLKFDDALDVFGVHGVGGMWGAIATGIFADPELSGGVEGLIYGSTDLFFGQIIAVVATVAFCFCVSYILVWVISKFMKVRVSEEEESIGEDIVEHGEPAYL